MDSADSWYPGGHPLSKQWPVPTSILPDELLSSWLVRAAHNQGTTPLGLTASIWPDWRPWTTDIDRFITPSRLSSLSSISGTSSNDIRSASLASLATLVNGALDLQSPLWPWILTVGARNTKRSGGLQYCPKCLDEDHIPHFRIQWRTAWTTVCEKHSCSLYDRCWRCSAPVELQRIAQHIKKLSICATCSSRLRAAPHIPQPISARDFQAAANCAIASQQIESNLGPVTRVQWFELAKFFVMFARRAANAKTSSVISLFDALEVALPNFKISRPGAAFELLEASQRQPLLVAAWGLMSSSYSHLTETFLNNGITRQALLGDIRTIPKALKPIFETLPQSERKKPSGRRRRKSHEAKSRYTVERRLNKLNRKLEMKQR